MGCQVLIENIKVSLSAFGLAFFVPAGLLAQDDPPPPEALDRGTPFSNTYGFLLATGAQDYQTAVNYLDLKRLPPEVAARLLRPFWNIGRILRTPGGLAEDE